MERGCNFAVFYLVLGQLNYMLALFKYLSFLKTWGKVSLKVSYLK